MAPKLELGVILDAPKDAVFVAGSKLSGVVIVDAKKEVRGKKVLVKVCGVESSSVRFHSDAETKTDANGFSLSESEIAAKEAREANKSNFEKALDEKTKALNDIKGFYSTITNNFIYQIQPEVMRKVEDEETDPKSAKKAAWKELDKYTKAAQAYTDDVQKIVTEVQNGGGQEDPKVFADVTERFLVQVVGPSRGGKDKTEIEHLADELVQIVNEFAFQEKESYENAADPRERQFLEIKLPLEAENATIFEKKNKVKEGRHEIPFQVELPDHLPSTSFFCNAGGSMASIKYRVEVELKGSGFLWNYKAQSSFRVRNKPLDDEPNPYTTASSTPVKSFGLLKQGILAFAAKVDDTKLHRGETTEVKLTFRNTAKVDVKKITAVLKQDIGWGAKSLTCEKNSELATLQFPAFDGTQKEPKDSGKGNALKNMLKEMSNDLEKGGSDDVHTVKVTMPKDAISSYSGSLVFVKHRLVISIEMDSQRVSGDTEIEIPIQCGEPAVQENDFKLDPEKALRKGSVVVTKKKAKTGGKTKKRKKRKHEVKEEEKKEEDDDDDEKPNEKSPPSLQVLLDEMEESIKDLEVVKTKIKDPEWESIFQKLSSKEFGKLFEHIDEESEVSKIGGLVAKRVSSFTCNHAIAALKRVPKKFNRTMLVKKLLPYCGDIKENHESIEKELTDWEQVSTEKYFTKALQ